MNKKQKIFLLVGLLILMGIWAIIAFFIQETLVSRFSLWASLIFGTGSLMVALIALVVSIDSNKKAEKLRLQKISEEANKFILDNNDEILYIPLCLIANAYDNHHKFVRKIYNEFNKLNKELQKEILVQLNYDYQLIENNNWIDKSIDKVRSFIKENDLGHDYLYEGAKYFHRAIKYSKETYDSICEYGHFMPDYFHWNPKIFFKDDKAYQENVSFYDYADSYLLMKSKNDPLYIVHKNDKPLDVLIAIQDLGTCTEDDVCYWEMEVVATICSLIERNAKTNDIIFYSKGDASVDTFEDRYLDVLMELYNLSLLEKRINK